MRLSKYMLIFKLADDYLIVNPVYKTAAKVDSELANLIRTNHFSKIPFGYISLLKQNKILVSEEENELEYLRSSFAIPDNLKFDRFDFVISWECNFACKYCFENKTKKNLHGTMNLKMISNAFDFIDVYRDEKRKLGVGLTGGEPLLLSNYPYVVEIFKQSNDRDAEIVISTNGFNLIHYKKLLLKYHEIIDIIRITIDGPEKIHNKRRPIWGGGDSFSQIIRGIDELLSEGFEGRKIVISSKWDEENINFLPEFIEFLKEKQWIGNLIIALGVPGNYGNYNLTKKAELLKRRRILKRFMEYLSEHPDLVPYIGFDDECKTVTSTLEIIFQKKLKVRYYGCRAFSLDNGVIFSPNGLVYPCIVFAESSLYPIGRYYPNQEIFIETIKKIRERHIFNLKQCHDCTLLPICAGGCPFIDLTYEEFEKLKNGELSLLECVSCMDKELMENDVSMFINKFKHQYIPKTL